MSGIPKRYRRAASADRDDSESEGEKAARLQALTVPKPYRRDLTKADDADIDDDDDEDGLNSEEEHRRRLRSIVSTSYQLKSKSKKEKIADDRVQYMSGIPKKYRRAASPSLAAASPSLSAPSPLPDKNQNAASDTDSEHRRLRKGRKRQNAVTATRKQVQGKTGTSEKKPVYTDSDSDYARLREGLMDLGPNDQQQDWAGVMESKTPDTDKTADAGADIGRGRRSRRGRRAPEQGVPTSGASKSRRGGKALGGKRNAPSSFNSGKQPFRKGKEPRRTILPADDTTIHVPATDANTDLFDNDTASHITVEDLPDISKMNAAADAAGRKAAMGFAIIDLTSPNADNIVQTATNPPEAAPKPFESVKTATATIEPAKDSAIIDLTSPGASDPVETVVNPKKISPKPVDPVENAPAAVDANETVSECEEEAPAPTCKRKGRKAKSSSAPFSTAPRPASPPAVLPVGPWTVYGNRHNPNLRARPLPAEIPSRAKEPEDWEDGPGQKADEMAFFAKVKKNRRGERG